MIIAITLEKTAAAIENCVKKAEKIVRELSKIAAQNERKLRADLDTAIDAGLSAMDSADICFSEENSAPICKSSLEFLWIL